MLTIKSITSCSINGKPLYSSNLTKRIIEYKNYVNSNYNEDCKINKNELTIVGVQGLYGYRCGVLGYLCNILNSNISERHNPSCFQTFLNQFVNNTILSNDMEIISFIISFVCGRFPLINIGNWDPKKNLFKNHPILRFSTKNISLPSILNLNSLYLLKPIFDSGCSIYSNKKPIDSGFERWENWDRGYFRHKIFNNGMIWSVYESENKENIIAIINLQMTEDAPDWVTTLQLLQMTRLKENLEIKFNTTNIYHRYETFVMGNFETKFDNINDANVKEKIKILEKNHLHVYSRNATNLENTNFVLHCEHIKKENDMLYIKDVTNYNLCEGDSIFNIEFSGIDEKIVVVDNPLNFIIIDDCLIEEKVEEPVVSKKEDVEHEKPVFEEIVIDKFVLNDEHFKKEISPNSKTTNSDSDWEIQTMEI